MQVKHLHLHTIKCRLTLKYSTLQVRFAEARKLSPLTKVDWQGLSLRLQRPSVGTLTTVGGESTAMEQSTAVKPSWHSHTPVTRMQYQDIREHAGITYVKMDENVKRNYRVLESLCACVCVCVCVCVLVCVCVCVCVCLHDNSEKLIRNMKFKYIVVHENNWTSLILAIVGPRSGSWNDFEIFLAIQTVSPITQF